MPRPQNILIFGATGTIGRFITQELHAAKSSFSRIGIFTSQATSQTKAAELQAWKEKGVNILIGDISSEEDVLNAYKGYDTVISALGRTAILLQIPLLKLASRAESSIKYFYPSEYGTDIEYNASSAHEKPHQLKLQVRRYIRENTTEEKKLYVTYLVTGPYSDLWLGKSLVKQAGSFDIANKKAVVLGTGNEKVSFTSMRDVGRLLVSALKTPPGSVEERILRVNSFTTSPLEVVGEFEKQTGGKWDVSYTSLEDVRRAEKEAWEQERPSATLFTLRRIWAEGGTLYDERDNGRIGVPDGELDTLESQVRKVIASVG